MENIGELGAQIRLGADKLGEAGMLFGAVQDDIETAQSGLAAAETAAQGLSNITGDLSSRDPHERSMEKWGDIAAIRETLQSSHGDRGDGVRAEYWQGVAGKWSSVNGQPLADRLSRFRALVEDIPSATSNMDKANRLGFASEAEKAAASGRELARLQERLRPIADTIGRLAQEASTQSGVI